jgi:hypothetical protein
VDGRLCGNLNQLNPPSLQPVMDPFNCMNFAIVDIRMTYPPSPPD